MSKKKGNGKIIAAAVIAAGMVAGTVAAGIILPQTNYVNITCYGNNGTVVEQRVRKNSAVVLPTPEREGFNFDGWYLNEEMTDAVTYGTKFNKSTKVYAGWELTANALADDATTLAETTGITKIGAGAFKGCTGLTNVTIPASVTSIGSNAFEGCNITNLYIEGNIYKNATSVNSLGGALTAAQNVFVKESVELSTRNNYFLEGNTLFYLQKTNGYVQFVKDSTRETKFTINYYNTTGTIIDYEQVRYRGSAKNAPTTSAVNITSTGVMKTRGWYTSTNGTTGVDLTDVKENKKAYQTLYKATFNECTWSEIKQVSDRGYQSGCFAVGDEKSITLTDGTNLTIQIADFNHDVNESNKTIGITCVTKEVLPSKYNQYMNPYMNSTYTNVGGWNSSYMRSYLNNNILSLLPNELQTSITSAVKKSTAGGSSTALGNDSIDKLFLLSCAEINYNTTADGYKGEGTPYTLFISADITTSGFWWLRSPFVGNPVSFHFVYNGSLAHNTAGDSYSICFGFCI